MATASVVVLLRVAEATAQEASLPQLIQAAADRVGVHRDLLTSIVWVESRGWPWALNIGGTGVYPRTRQDAARVLARIGDDVDIGYGQVSYRYWGAPLGLSKGELLDPWTNLVVAAAILRYTMSQEPGWGGVGRYHSAIWDRKASYAIAVARTYAEIQAFRATGRPRRPR